jgi:hypothetical protein
LAPAQCMAFNWLIRPLASRSRRFSCREASECRPSNLTESDCRGLCLGESYI